MVEKEPTKETNTKETKNTEGDKQPKKKHVVWEGVLKNTEIGKVVTRFPPEPSGYLHIGHLKACVLNRFFADLYQGKMLLRFDDTNPEKEDGEFVDNIIDDLKTAQIDWVGEVTHVTDYMDLCEDHMTKLIEKGLCYCDNTPVDVMRTERDKGTPSKYRDVSAEENMKIWVQMKDKSIPKDSPIREYCVAEENMKIWVQMKDKTIPKDSPIREYCVRAKIDYKCKNKCLRDPVFYRFVEKPHHRLGDKYKIYPLYDFCIAIVDHIGGVTHMLRTNEYADRIPMYRWVEKACDLPEMNIYEYSRLNLVHTVLSKRKLKWLVENQKVDGWTDPRLPTLKGIMRRGVRIESIKEFILEIGPSTNTNMMKWDKLYALNKDYIDPTAKRLFAVSADSPVEVVLENFNEEESSVKVDWHPKNKELGQREQIRRANLFIEPEDAKDLVEGMKLTLYKWGNSRVTKVEKNDNDEIKKVFLRLTPEDQDFKKTKIAHWVSAKPEDTVKVTMVELIMFIEPEDAKDLVEGLKLTLYKWGNSRVTKVEKNDNDEIKKVFLRLTPEDQDFKKTKIAHWVSAKPEDTVKVTMVEYDHIINKEKIEEDDKIEDVVNNNSRFETPLLIEKGFLSLKHTDCIQLERRGYFYLDQFAPQGRENGTFGTINYIPDGKSNSMSIVKTKVDPKVLAQGTDTVKKSKKQEKLEKNKDKKEKKKEEKEKKAEVQKEEQKEEK
eukprot:CAMPEP_0170535766 /NCGR_PEP_ID=MMETSP0209-20121228/101779_1 /TAXON_ID=665100 ORGANISM="Litonotus pictus, Strain P1" /NCGR_SAMPLE_ID=MMETSP0209 /ASSEMBLY_ACC=CAM_ASM_000301 /LENGTH=719 /DNA_ID=CAMNT_0010837065 /DNA_START=26 /DNA_END=2186 /DNA_ORIENTATION=+